MKSLLEEMDKMCGDMVMIEGIVRSHPHIPNTSRRICVKKKKRGRKSTKLTDEGRMMVQFRERIFNVIKDLQTFRVETSNKLLLRTFQSKTSTPSTSKIDLVPVPEVKIEIDDDIDMDTEDNYYISPPTSPAPSSPPPPITDTMSEDLDLTPSSDEEIPEDYEDLDFDPSQRTTVKLNKKISKYSPFRRALISRIRSRSTIATSAYLPSSKSDPRRPFLIKYYSSTNEFSLNGIPFNCLDIEKSLQCSQCNFSVNSIDKGHKERNVEDWIFDHILSKHLHVYDCKICRNSYPTGVKFNEHLKSHENQFTCDICQRPLASGKGVKAHKWTHLSEEEKKEPKYQSWMPSNAKVKDVGIFQCETCGKVFRKKRILKEHETTHEDGRERVMCPDCGKQVFLSNLKVHQSKWCEKVRDPRTGLDCKVCGANVRTLKLLHQHLKERHPEERTFGCEVCGGKFKTKFILRDHQRDVHNEGNMYLCGRCGRGFKQRKNCKRHEGTCKA